HTRQLPMLHLDRSRRCQSLSTRNLGLTGNMLCFMKLGPQILHLGRIPLPVGLKLGNTPLCRIYALLCQHTCSPFRIRLSRQLLKLHLEFLLLCECRSEAFANFVDTVDFGTGRHTAWHVKWLRRALSTNTSSLCRKSGFRVRCFADSGVTLPLYFRDPTC